MKIRPDLREFFFGKILALEPGNPDACVVWTGAENSDAGYGRMWVGWNNTGKRINKLTTHVSWFLKYGYWPGFLMHSCDNPPCVRIKHLKEGDHQANTDDMISKGRKPRSGRLTDPQILEIRNLCETTNMTHTEIAAIYGVGMMEIAWIHERRVWKNLLGSKPPRKKQRYEIEGERLDVEEIAGRAGVDLHTIYDRIRRGLTGRALCAAKQRAPRKAYTRKK